MAQALDESDPDEPLKLTAIAEKSSEHPLAVAIPKKSRFIKLEIPEAVKFQAIAGKNNNTTNFTNSICKNIKVIVSIVLLRSILLSEFNEFFK